MTTYESDIKTISSSEEMVFNILSDLKNLKKFENNTKLNSKVKNVQFDTDTCSFVVEGFGKVGLRIVEREPNKTIKFDSENAPVQFNMWIQLNPVSEAETTMKLTLKAELPMIIKMMVDKKLKEGINMLADMLAKAL